MPAREPADHEHLRDVGEFGLLDRMLPRLPQSPAVALGPGDDAAVLDLGGTQVLVCTDVLVEGSHFRRDWSGGYDVGRKAAAVNMADIAAMGGRAVALLAAVAAPGETEVDWLTAMADGLRDEAQTVGCSVVGGDMVSGPQVSVAVTAVGVLDGPLVTRSGAAPGDVVAVCGRLGYSAAGLAVLRRGFSSPRSLTDAHRCPSPPYAAGPEAARLGATAMIDVSDGLLGDLGHVAHQSGVRIVLDTAALPVPDELAQMARGLGVDARTWVFGGGEDHALAACFPPGTQPGQAWTTIGVVEEGSGVALIGWDAEGEMGYEHFR